MTASRHTSGTATRGSGTSGSASDGDGHLDALVRLIARTTLEVERGWRPADQLLRFMPPPVWERWQRQRPPGSLDPAGRGPVQDADVGPPRLSRTSASQLFANLAIRTAPGRWAALSLELQVGQGRWQVVSLRRLETTRHYRTGPPPPVAVPLEQRIVLVRADLRLAGAAVTAAERRMADLAPGDPRHRSASQIAATWRSLVGQLQRELAALHERQQARLAADRMLRR